MAKHIILTDEALSPADVILTQRTALPQTITGLTAGDYTVRDTSAAVAGTVTGAAVAPTLGTPTIAGTAEEGQLLTAASGAVTGSPAPVTAWQWLRGAADITGATAGSYALQAADVGAEVAVRQTVTNAAGSASATSAAVTVSAASGPAAAPGAIGHWLFGTDHAGYQGLAGGSLAPNGAAPTLSDGYMTFASGAGNGLLTGLDEPAALTMCMTVRVPAGAGGIISGGTMVNDGSTPGGCSFVFPGANRYSRCNSVSGVGGGAAANTIEGVACEAGAWFFVAFAHAADGSWTGFKSRSGGNVTATGSAARAAGARKLSVGHVWAAQTSGWGGVYDIAEMIYLDSAASAAGLADLYAAAKARLAPRGIALP